MKFFCNFTPKKYKHYEDDAAEGHAHEGKTPLKRRKMPTVCFTSLLYISQNSINISCHNGEMTRKNQSSRLKVQQQEHHGVIGIFGSEAKLHDVAVGEISHHIILQLGKDYPQLTFRYRKEVEKKEINEVLKAIDPTR